jgi:asparagine synthase (glutamine-hydrolysing)
VLRRAVRDLLPARTLAKKKRGFHIPVARWFRGPGRGSLHDVLLSPRSLARGYLDPVSVRAVVAEHMGGAVDHGARLWALLQLEVWHRTYVDAS